MGRTMQRDDLTREQIEIVQAKIGQQLRYLGRLRAHMERAGFHSTDKTYGLVVAAYDATHHLSVDLHYLCCDRVRRDRDGA